MSNKLEINHRCRCGWHVAVTTGSGESAWTVFERVLLSIKDHEAQCASARALTAMAT